MKLNGRVALITGAGTGIGRAISELFAREGALIVLNYRRSRDGAEEVASRIRSKGGSAISIASDVSRETEVRSMVARTHAEFGRLDILVNNAGWSTGVPHHKLEELTDEIWDRTLDTNLRGSFYCIRASVPFLCQRRGASIINIAPTSGTTGVGSSIVYAASKAGMLAMTKSLARALAPQIRVNAISPGLIRTRFANRQDSDPAFEAEAKAKATPRGRTNYPRGCSLAANVHMGGIIIFSAKESRAANGRAWTIPTKLMVALRGVLVGPISFYGLEELSMSA